MKQFRDRKEAGQLLAQKLAAEAAIAECAITVLALPRGGVPVALEVAKTLHAPLDVLVVRKLGVPWQPELALGAVAGGNVRILNHEIVADWGISSELLEAITTHERAEVARREELYRGGRPPLDVHGRTAILVDDGIATGATMLAAVQALAQLEPARLIVAVPVAPPDVCAQLRRRVDALICLQEPRWFDAVGLWYTNFPQVSDEEVRVMLDAAASAVAVVA